MLCNVLISGNHFTNTSTLSRYTDTVLVLGIGFSSPPFTLVQVGSIDRMHFIRHPTISHSKKVRQKNTHDEEWDISDYHYLSFFISTKNQ